MKEIAFSHVIQVVINVLKKMDKINVLVVKILIIVFIITNVFNVLIHVNSV